MVFGVRITLYDPDQDQEFTYRLVGPEEADPKQSKISLSSPIGRAILGRGVGDAVTVRLPNGTRTLEIMAIDV